MKKTLIALAAAVTLSLGFAGGASASAGLDFGARNGADVAPVARYWRCRHRRGYKVTHMTYRRGRAPLCHYTRLHYSGWRATRAAWRHCRYKYGSRVIRALESRTQYRCIYRR